MPNVPTTNVGLSGDIQAAAGGSNPASMSEYYAGDATVWSVAAATAAGVYGAIPASGAISMGTFRNKFFFKATISSNRTTTYNVMTEAQAAGFAPASQTLIAIITVNSGIYLVGTSAGTANYAFDTGTGYTNGASIHLINNGIIAGRGGAGGTGNAGTGGTGGQGGSGVRTQLGSGSLRITNNGTVAAGGGGGGGGGGGKFGTGGGGGGGRSLGAGGAGTPAGSAGTTTGAGGGGVSGGGGNGGNGGAGGAYGASGSTGGSDASSGGAGGGPGACTNGNANITWIVTGTRIGTLG